MKLYIKIIFLILFISPTLIFAQSIERYSFTSAGGFYSKDISIDFSLGQNIVQPFINNNILTSGFQQPEYKNSKKQIVNKDQTDNFIINCFPNPVKSSTSITVTSATEIKNFSLKIFSIDGKEISIPQKPYYYKNFLKIELDLSNLLQGEYIIKSLINNNFTNSFTIVKL